MAIFKATIYRDDLVQVDIMGGSYHRFYLFQNGMLLGALLISNDRPSYKEIHENLGSNPELKETVLDWLDALSPLPKEHGYIRVGSERSWLEVSVEGRTW